MAVISQRITIGMLGPLLIQVLLVMLYSSIVYKEVSSRLLLFAFLVVFPLLLMHVISPFLLAYYGMLKERIEVLFDKGLDQVLDHTDQHATEESRSMLRSSLPMADEERARINQEIKDTLLPLLVKPAVEGYKDTFYSRELKTKTIESLEYYESLALFSIYTIAFFAVDLTLTWILKFNDVNLLIIYFDDIEEWNYIIALTIFFVTGIVLSYILFNHSIKKIELYLPYVVPGLFYEDPTQNYLRREQIRSLLSYNFDSLIPRATQKRSRELLRGQLEKVVSPLLEEELMISSRKNLALKLAFKEYSLILAKKVALREERGQSLMIDRLLLGEVIAGKISFEKENLLGLNTDLMYVRSQISKWKDLSKEQREMTYILLYRLIERILKEVVFLYSPESFEVTSSVEVNFYDALRWLVDNGIMNKKAYDNLNHFRYLRNQVIHEPGTELQVSSRTLIDVLRNLNSILEELEKRYLEDSD